MAAPASGVARPVTDNPSESSGELDWFEPWYDEERPDESPGPDWPTRQNEAEEGSGTAGDGDRTEESEEPRRGDRTEEAPSEEPRRGDRPRSSGPARILVVEDDPEAQLLATRAAEGTSRDVHLAGTMEDARAELEAEDFDVVLLDLILPDGDGRELLAEIRERARSAQIQVLVLSGKTGRNTKLECFRLGADEFIEKPVDPEILEAAVDRQVGRARTRATEARVDPLTGLPNRAALIEQFSELRAVSERTQAPLVVALVELLDLDRLGREGGRKAVDRIQVGAAEIISETVQEPDVIGRWEDGIFVAVLPGAEPSEVSSPLRRALDRAHLNLGPDALRPELVGAIVSGLRFQNLRDAVLEAEGALTGARPEEGERVVVHSTDTEEAPQKAFRVLLVEDDEVIAHLVQHRLERSGMTVVHLDSGGAAQDLIESASPGDFDIALLDVKLPGAGGFELLQRLKETPGWTELPVVMVTSMGQESDVVRAFELGADDYVLKPLSPPELLARIHRLLRRR